MSTSVSFPQRARGRTGLRLAAIGLAAALCACGPDVTVRTVASPEASTLAGRHTFRVVEASHQAVSHDGNGDGNAISSIPSGNANTVSNYGVQDPMVDNSITSAAVAAEIKSAFEAKGYRYSPDHADFEIQYDATIAPILDVRSYDFGGYGYYGYNGYAGYHGYYDWGGSCCGYDGGYGYATATYDRGTVIIDIVDPGTGKLLWRGQGTSGMYSEPKKYMKQLHHAVYAVAKKFPNSTVSPIVAYKQ